MLLDLLVPKMQPGWYPEHPNPAASERREVMPREMRGEAAAQGWRMRVWPLDHPAPTAGAGGRVGVRGREVALGEAGLRREGVWCPLLGQPFKSTLALRKNKQLIDPSARDGMRCLSGLRVLVFWRFWLCHELPKVMPGWRALCPALPEHHVLLERLFWGLARSSHLF